METRSATQHLALANLASGLAAATAEWLAEKAQLGLNESLLSEAMLIIPLVAYFTDHDRSKAWNLIGEWSESGTSLAKAGDVNIDLVAEHGAEKVLLEFKYLKRTNDQRLVKDFVKLVLPKNACYTRLLLVAHSPRCHLQGDSKSTLVRALASAGRKAAFHLSPRGSLPELTSDLSIKHSLSGIEGKDIRRIMNYDPSIADFAVELVGSCHKAGENVTVFSISRI